MIRRRFDNEEDVFGSRSEFANNSQGRFERGRSAHKVPEQVSVLDLCTLDAKDHVSSTCPSLHGATSGPRGPHRGGQTTDLLQRDTGKRECRRDRNTVPHMCSGQRVRQPTVFRPQERWHVSPHFSEHRAQGPPGLVPPCRAADGSVSDLGSFRRMRWGRRHPVTAGVYIRRLLIQ